MEGEPVKTPQEWVDEAWRLFVKDAEGIDPTDPVAAIRAYFDAHASEDLKRRAAEEKKTAAGCWDFVMRVAKKALNGRNGHIDPGVVYAIAMHWFEDVPADWDKPPKPPPKEVAKTAPAEAAASAAPAERSAPEAAEEKAPDLVEPAPAKTPKPAKAKRPSKPRSSQSFFFDVLEEGGGDADARADG